MVELLELGQVDSLGAAVTYRIESAIAVSPHTARLANLRRPPPPTRPSLRPTKLLAVAARSPARLSRPRPPPPAGSIETCVPSTDSLAPPLAYSWLRHIALYPLPTPT